MVAQITARPVAKPPAPPNGKTEPVAQIIGRIATLDGAFWRSPRLPVKSVDQTRPDYAFWDKLRRGKQKNYEIACLFITPIVETLASWILGDDTTTVLLSTPPEATEMPEDRRVYTDALLGAWFSQHRPEILTILEDAFGLGDMFVFINPDGSWMVPPPDIVQLEFDETDYRKLIAVRIENKLDDVDVIERWTDTERTVTLDWHDPQRPDNITTYPNLIQRIPMVHFAFGRSTNELFGHPLVEPLLSTFAHYDDVFVKMMDGVKLMGNPVPTYTGLDSVNEQISQLATSDTEEYTDQFGTQQERELIKMDRNMVVFTTGDFKFVGPPVGFTADLRAALKSLFYMILDYTRIPEFVWGGAIPSSKASAETQLPPFLRYVSRHRILVEGRNSEAANTDNFGGITDLADIYLRYAALTDPRVLVADTRMNWSPLHPEADQKQLNKLAFGRQEGIISDETALRKLNLGLDDLDRELDAAESDSKDRMEQAQQALAPQATPGVKQNGIQNEGRIDPGSGSA